LAVCAVSPKVLGRKEGTADSRRGLTVFFVHPLLDELPFVDEFVILVVISHAAVEREEDDLDLVVARKNGHLFYLMRVHGTKTGMELVFGDGESGDTCTMFDVDSIW
jgi:hypothetical protein